MSKSISRALPLALSIYFLSVPAQSCDPSARVFFVRPFNRATVVSPFRVTFASELVEVKPVPAGEPGDNTGHYDLIINQQPGGLPVGVRIAHDNQHLLFDRGESEAQLALAPGRYTLTLQFADGENRSHSVEMSASIEITVLDRLPSRSGAGT